MIGPFINAGCIVAGGLLGACTGRVIHAEFRVRINYVFACVSMSLGVFMLSKAKSMPPAIIAILLGTALVTGLVGPQRNTHLPGAPT